MVDDWMVRCCGCGDVFIVSDPDIKELLEHYGVNDWKCLDCKNEEVKDGRCQDK